MIYKKIKKSKEDNLLKMNAFEAANAGSSKFDLRSKEEKDKTVNVKSTEASNPITKSALRKNGDPDDYKYLMDANFNSMGGRLLNRNRYLEGVNLPELSQAKKFEDSSGSPAYDKFLKDKYLNNFKIVREKIKVVEERDRVRNFQPPINGEEIMNYFNIKPCKEIGQIKNFIKESILSGDIQNSYKQAYNLMIEKGRELGLKND